MYDKNTGWYKIHTQRDMPNSGYNGADVTLRTNSNGYLDISNWINVTSHGIYSSNINGFHFLPNQVSDYGVARLIGTRSGYSGINYNNKTTLMMGDDTIGLYNDENELLAVAKLSTPLLKDFTKEALVRIKLDY